jgi:hypothetical protein
LRLIHVVGRSFAQPQVFIQHADLAGDLSTVAERFRTQRAQLLIVPTQALDLFAQAVDATLRTPQLVHLGANLISLKPHLISLTAERFSTGNKRVDRLDRTSQTRFQYVDR